MVAAFGGNLSPFLSGFNSSLLVNTLLGIPPPPSSLLSARTPTSATTPESFTDPRSIFPLNLSNNNNNGLKEVSEDEAEQQEKSSSIADLRMKAKKHQESLGINDSD